MERPGKNIWSHLSLEKKILLAVTLMILTLFISNIFIYLQVNKIAGKMDTVYASNVNLSELSEALEHVQKDMGDYVSVKSSDSLESYYKSQQEYQGLLERLNDKTIDKPGKILEKNIRMMSESYLDMTQDAVQAKRGRNVERYREAYERALTLYQYINTRISELNELQFKNNSASYQTMREALRYMEVFNMVILMIVMLAGLMVLSLARTANLVGQGNFNVKMPDTDSNDEIGIVTRTFNQMVGSLEEYVAKVKEGAEKEQELLERELLMENHLKEARLKYLQSQINPHFLFNSLNAGAQLAMMEDAEKTCIFLDKMAEFFRYNVKKGLEDATVGDETAAAENYIYILNVRFAGDIQFKESIDQRVLDVKMPSMILQPIVENAVRHGIRGMEENGTILLTVHGCRDSIRISVRDNGKGMSRERILEVMEGRKQETPDDGDSTGIGLDNVVSRLELYYQQKGLVQIVSEGPGMGTEVIIHIPVKEEIGHVSDITGR